ncbi:mitochondrial translation release factor in rescue [Bactrocera neohumeralis]|uniref:mitochondrial translation release factor in rescue n=1 Tax=Bactrocera neohumeralis TaxID=98809 RepID=UPI001A97018D|nr:probable peptide chain release factor C12orf65 homolog, mitochondrial [Bactrocera tryoni]XP_050324017.1 mitochondrial translation release factor in rescue [Bactrocera neohumeralis]
MLQRLVGRAAARHNALPTSLAESTTCYRFKTNNNKIDYSKYPKLNEDDLEEDFMRGSGPGGQSVNKTSNCVFLRHIPTNLTIKCHTHRLASKNRIEARKLLLEKLDAHFNGENAVAAQLKILESKKSTERKRRQQKLNEMKKNWKEREQAISDSEERA